MTLRVELVAPEGEVWSGRARMVIAKTLDGDIGLLTGHPPVLGILAEGSLVRVLDPEDSEGGAAGAEIMAAVSGGFLSVADDRVSVLARQAELGHRIDRAQAEAVLAEAGQPAAGEQESAEVRYSRALLRAAGGQS
jgi:F-type H+-transporting ATPase subunit epsilon